MADRPRILTKITAAVLDGKDGFVLDTGVGSSGHDDETFFLPLEELTAYLATLAQTLENKTLDTPTIAKPAITGEITCEDSTLVTNLNADKVDGCDTGAAAGNIPVLAAGAVAGKLDTGFLNQAASTFVRQGDCPLGLAVTLTSGVLNMTAPGLIVAALTADGTANLPLCTESDIGKGVLVYHQSGAFKLSVNANTEQTISMFLDTGSDASATTISLDDVGAVVRLEYAGSGLWIVLGGYKIGDLIS